MSSASGAILALRSSRRGSDGAGGTNAVAADDSGSAVATVLSTDKVDALGTELPRSGSLRTIVGTGGFGARRATSSSISRFDLPAASANTSSWFSVVRCGVSERSPARCTFPERSTSRITGMLRAARAIAIRLQATSSEKPSSQTQKVNIEENDQSR